QFFPGPVLFACRPKTPAYVSRMGEEHSDQEEILEIIDRRRPAAHPVKYVVLGLVAVAFIAAGYRLLSHFTPREFIGAASEPLEKSAALTGRFLRHVGDFIKNSHVSTNTE